MRFRRLTVALGAGGMALVVPLLLAGPAAAQGIGGQPPCSAMVNGEPIDTYSTPSSALRVQPTDELRVSGFVNIPGGGGDNEEFLHHEVKLELGGVGWTVDSGDASDNSWSGTVAVKKYSKHGEGIYKVVAFAIASNGIRCRDAAYVRVGDANPLDTTSGKAAAGVAVLGAGATLLGGRKQFGSVDEEMDKFDKGLKDAETPKLPPSELGDDAANQRDRAEAAGWEKGVDAEIERLRALRDSEERKVMAMCGTVAVTAVGLTALAMAQDAAHHVAAVIGRIPR